MSQVPVFGLACDVFCVLHRFSVAGRPIFEDLQRYEAPPATIPTITCDGPPHRNGITITRDGLPWADSVLPLQAVPKYDGMTWNTESATTHQSLASNCLSVTYLQYIPRLKIERGMYYNSHSHNNLAATKKRPSGWPATFFVFCTGFPSQVGRFLRTCNGTHPHLQRYGAPPAAKHAVTCNSTEFHLRPHFHLLAAEQPITYFGMR